MSARKRPRQMSESTAHASLANDAVTQNDTNSAHTIENVGVTEALYARIRELEAELLSAKAGYHTTHRKLLQDIERREGVMAAKLSRKQSFIGEEKESVMRDNEAEKKKLVDEVTSLRKLNEALKDPHQKANQAWVTHIAEQDAIYQKHLDDLRASLEIREQKYEARFEAIEAVSTSEESAWDEVLGQNFLVRDGPDYPPQINLTNLRTRWSSIWESSAIIFMAIRDLEDFEMASLPKDSLAESFKLLMQRICASVQDGNGDETSELSEYFGRVTRQPSGKNIVHALFLASLLEWCFTTNFHTNGLESQKLGQLWEAIAQYGNLEQVRRHDRLAIAHRANDKTFKTLEIPEMAAHQALDVARSLGDMFPADNEAVVQRVAKLLESMMKIKVDVLYAASVYKLAYVPPGEVFDYNLMEAVDESRVDMDIAKREASKYRVRLCPQPLLVSADDTELPQHKETARDYREVLLESRTFFPEKRGQYKDWDERNTKVVGKAVVLIEEVVDKEAMGKEVVAGPVGDDLDL